MLSVLVACEFSGIVRDCFREKGHYAMSCDLLESETPGPHYKGRVEEVLEGEWDIIVAHPPCTRLCLSGLRWIYERSLWDELDSGAAFLKMFLDSKCPAVAVENPIPHRHAVKRIGRKYDQKIQPWQFGEPESKAICLWLEGLPRLSPTKVISQSYVEHAVHQMSPTKERSKERSRFYEGIAAAMANQWSSYLEEGK